MSTEATHDERLAAALAELTRERSLGNGAPDLDAALARHPDLAEELRQLWAVVQFADAFASPATLTHTGAAPPAHRTPLPHSFGDYELSAELGRGGMGVVYKAWDKKLKRFVALKTILRGPDASADDSSRFRVEAQAPAGLSHPNIVPVYQVGEQDGQAFFCMKYVEGPTLAELIKQGPLPPSRAARYVAVIARAIHHAHENGILHRDLKPANVLVDGDDQPLVTDFGLAKRVQDPSLTGSGAILGTPCYMAPEQTTGVAQPSPAADIYSLGAILYELLTGRPPFLAASPVETLLLVRSEIPVRPRLLNPQIDSDLDLICRKCLEKRPEHRYTSAGHLADDLEAFLKGEPVSARTSSLIDFVERLFRETHHAAVLENWGMLWMVHSVKLFLLCAVTGWMYAWGIRSHGPYLALWSIGLVAWGMIFWSLRRRGGPVTFVERQIAHAWGAGVTASIGTFVVEVLLGFEVLILSPMLAVAAGMVFLVKAGTLSGWFYIAAGLSFLCAIPMALIGPPWSTVLFGAVCAVGFFVPGLKYYRLRKRKNAPLSPLGRGVGGEG